MQERSLATEETAERAAEAAAGATFAAACLAAIGAIAIFSATAPLDFERAIPPHFLRHAGALVVGGAAAWLASRVSLKAWYRAAPLLWLLGVILLIATALAGHSAGGAQRWLLIPGLGIPFQPAEFAKLATVLGVAAWLSGGEGRAALTRQGVFGALFMAALPASLCLVQPDLGNAVLIAGLTGLLLFIGGSPFRILLTPAAVGGIAIALYSWLHPHAMRRWIGFLDPWGRANSEGFQLVQSFVAFGRGGWFGVGLGDGRQKLFYLPEAHTDFILSVIAEELGLVGVLLVLGAFAALWIMGTRVALHARQRFPMLLAFGMTSLLAVPAAMNAAVVMGLLPTKGLTLPFLSYGRTSLLTSCIAIGIVVGVARNFSQPEAKPRERVKERVR